MIIDLATAGDVMTAAPWWGTPAISGVSVLIGALLTQGTILLSSSRSHKRDVDLRNDERAREVSLRVLTEATRLFDHRSRNNDPGLDSELLLAWTELPLVASQDVYDAGDWLVQKTVAYSILPEADDRQAVGSAIKEYHRARESYVSAIRAESGLSAITGH